MAMLHRFKSQIKLYRCWLNAPSKEKRISLTFNQSKIVQMTVENKKTNAKNTRKLKQNNQS